MRYVDMKYGKQSIKISFPESSFKGLIEGHFPRLPTSQEEEREILRSLREPIGSAPLSEIAKKGQKVIIIASDITRSVPSWRILPILINELNTCGIPDADITVMFGLGLHREHNSDEHRLLLGDELYGRIKCQDSVPGPYVYVGTSSQGTPYYVNEAIISSDLIICTGNIEYHWFAGYSGGAKAILPGACDPVTIQNNHSKILHPKSRTGLIIGNPIREDIDEIMEFIKIDFILNVVLDDEKRILRSFAGHPISAHRKGCIYLDGIYRQEISCKADVVVISCGGYPRDINLYQAQKALANGSRAVRDGGIIIMLASCQEGFGNETFERWMHSALSPQHILSRIESDFQLGGHKAASFAKVLVRAQVMLVSDLEHEKVEKAFMIHTPIEGLQRVIDKYCSEAKSVLVIPQAGSICPFIRADN